MKLFDLHTHTFFSDGLATPIEQVRYAQKNGIKVIALTDHVDFTNYRSVADSMLQIVNDTYKDIDILIGYEITHVSPDKIDEIVQYGRDIGLNWIGVHGETVVEPVIKGTNRAAIEAGVNFLAHPGFITDSDMKLASEKGVFVELTLRGGHSLTNGFVYQKAKKFNTPITIDSDAHKVTELLTKDLYKAVALGSGMDQQSLEEYNSHLSKIVYNILKK